MATATASIAHLEPVVAVAAAVVQVVAVAVVQAAVAEVATLAEAAATDGTSRRTYFTILTSGSVTPTRFFVDSSSRSTSGRPDLAEILSTLGITEDTLVNALGIPEKGAGEGPQIDFSTAAGTLGDAIEALMDALNLPEGGR